MRRRILLVPLLGAALVLGLAPAAQAHGERSQEAFLRMRTIGWADIRFSDNTVRQGETFTITGRAKVMNSWPTNLSKGNPNTGYISIIAPGPVVVLKERSVNGVSMPSRIDIRKGETYEFEMTVAGRRPGRWHVHPSFAVKGAGTLLGPGKWITVEENPDGFVNEATLVNGDTVNLENYQLPYVWIWLTITFLIGLAWMIYWTVPKRTVTNLAVTSQIPVNTDGMEYGLITKRDHRNMNWFALGTALLLIVGWIYQTAAFPDKMPQQVVQFAPPALDPGPQIATARATTARYDPAADTLTLEVDATNTGQQPIQVTEFTTSNLTFVNQAGGARIEDDEIQNPMTVAPQTPIAPGQTQKLTLSIKDPVWEGEHLVPIGEAQLLVVGLVGFQSANGDQSRVEVQAPLSPEGLFD